MTETGAAATTWEGEPTEALAGAWGVPFLEVFESLGSTNDRLRELAEQGTPAFSVVLAEEQTAGRGREGRPWLSPAGAGLWLSVLVGTPSSEPSTLLPLLAGVAVCRAIRATCPETEPGLKWPNDVVLGGRKVCGVLCESSGSKNVVVGVGVNVRQGVDDFPPELRDSAVSLESATGGPVDRVALAANALRCLREVLEDPPARLEGPLAGEVDRLDTLQGRLVRDASGREGIAIGIAPDGSLRIRTRAGVERCVIAGGVTLVGTLG